MRKKLFDIVCVAAWLHLCGTIAFAQPSVYSGAYNLNQGHLTSQSDLQVLTNFVATAQKDVSIINDFDEWTTASATSGTKSFPTSEMNNIRAHGSMPMFTWMPQNGTAGSLSLATIIGGGYDTYITNWAVAAKSWGNPFFLRFAHEMNGNWYPWSIGTNGNTSAQFVQMWQHVHDIFTSVGATNVTWVWCVNVIFSGSTPISALYPGDNYVDWLAVDGYNRLANSWQDFSGVMAPTMVQLTNLAPGKPVMIAETGCNQSNYPPETKAQWFLNALTNYLPVVQPRIKAWVYFNSTNATDGNDWRITIPASATTGYQQGIALAYYDTNRYGSISTSPIQPLLNDATTVDTMSPFVSINSPATDIVTNGASVKIIALASDKSGVSNVVFAVNGVAQQTNNSPPYQFSWTVPFQGVTTYNVTATASDNAGNSAVSTVQLVSQGTIVQTVTEASPMDWNNTAVWGNPAAVAANGNNYETPGGFVVRTPNSTNPAAFAGSMLQIDSGGALQLKNGGETAGIPASVNLVLNGGSMVFHGGFAPNGAAISGTIQVTANSTITTDQTGVNAADIWLQSPISGGGNLTVNLNSTTNAVILSGSNSAFSGNWTNASTNGSIKIVSGTTNALGSGTVSLLNPGASLIFNSSNNLVVNNAISGPGSVQQIGTDVVTLNAADTFTGPLTISSGTLQLGASASIAAATIQLLGGAGLNVASVSGGFAIGIAQTLAGSGNVSGNVTINGTLSPGNLRTLNFVNNLTLAGTTVIELNRTNLQNADSISASTIAFGGTLTVTNLGGALSLGDSFQLFFGSISGGFAATNLPALATNLYWDASKLNSQGVLAVAVKVPATPVILPPSINGTNLVLQVNSQTGFNYVLETTPGLIPTAWTGVKTNNSGGLLTFTVPISPGIKQFFRIRAY